VASGVSAGTASGPPAGTSTQRGADLRHRIGHRTTRRILSPIVVLFALYLTAPDLAAQQAPAGEQEHVVRRGDTLWDLARAYLGNPFLWPAIHQANTAIVANPHWIYPAQRLQIPGRMAAGQGAPRPYVAAPVAAADAVSFAMEWERPERTRFYRESTAPTVLETTDALRRLVRADEFRFAPWAADTSWLRPAARIVRTGDPATASDRLTPTVSLHERFHVGELAAPTTIGDSMLVARIGRLVPGLGRVIEPLGVAVVEAQSPNMATLQLVRQSGDVRVGDALLPLDRVPELPVGELRPTTGGVEGLLVELLRNHALPNTMDYAFINLGRDNGLRIGDELDVYIPAHTVNAERGEILPDTPVATVRVIRVEEQSATVRIVAMNTTRVRSGLPVRLIRRAG
jgi:hypothetical protein